MLKVNIDGFLSHMKFFKSSSDKDAGAENNSSEDGVAGYTTADDLINEVDPLLDTTNEISGDDGQFDKANFVKLIGEALLDLRRNFNVIAAATSKTSEFIMDILRVKRKFFRKVKQKSPLRNNSFDNVVTLNCETQ